MGRWTRYLSGLVGLLCLPSAQSRDTGDHPDRKVHLRSVLTYSMDFFPSLGLCPFGDSWRLSSGGEWCCTEACAWCMCACRQVLCREKEKDRPPALETVHIHISSVPASFFHTFWRLLGRLGGPWACITCSSPGGCGERGAAWVFLVIIVWCPCQGGMGTN